MSDWLLFLSRLKISGDLPLLSLSLSDLRLQEILQLAQSIPLPEDGGEDQELEMDVFSVSLINPQGASCSLTSLTLMAPVAALCHWLLLMQKYWISIKNGHYYRDLFKIWYKRQSMWSQQIIQNSSLSNWYLFAPIENDSIINLFVPKWLTKSSDSDKPKKISNIYQVNNLCECFPFFDFILLNIYIDKDVDSDAIRVILWSNCHKCCICKY